MYEKSFEKWWLNNNSKQPNGKNYTESTKAGYFRACKLLTKKLDGENIFTISNIKVLEKLLNRLEKGDLHKYNSRAGYGNTDPANGLKHYIKYIQFIQNKNKIYLDSEDNLYQEDIHKSPIPSEIIDAPMTKRDSTKKNGLSLYPRNRSIAHYALNKANYKCEINKFHNTFQSKVTEENYVEAHHLIPIKEQNRFDFSLDVVSNIISLCPNCHKLLHYGKDIDKTLDILYEKRKNRLEVTKIGLSLEDLKTMYK
jgi:5-methylcytosine-specific restriction enzyme A